MTYPDFVARLLSATLGDTSTPSAGFTTLLPQAIDYAEQRLYRELNLASNSVRDNSFALNASSRDLILPTGAFVTVQKVNVITPAGTLANSGTRNALTLVDWDFLDAVYGSLGTRALPQYWALQDAANLAVGPWPDQSYRVEIIGTKRPAPLSAGNMSTTLTLYFPDLFFTAAMVFMSGALLRNYGAQSDDPQQGVTWEGQYGKLLASADTEQARLKAAAA